ncbi:phosphoribosylformylglycinamidine cyclo-ligase [Bdellovibrionota bacterium FG-2]
MSALNYEQAGVNREAADRLVEKIQTLVKPTLNSKVKSSIGGYASLYAIDKKRFIAASTDGVGTKLKLAFRLNQHKTVGIDLVAMSVNDLLCVGAEPLFFLDYFATGKLDAQIASDVIAGIVTGCKQAHCALVGGETAEMPDFYATGEYDLAGFAVGLVDANKTLPQQNIRPGDVLIGLRSSGCHSNGFSFLRRFVPEGIEGLPIARDLLHPTRIYVEALKGLIKKGDLKGLAHITGSGFLNVPRMNSKVSYEIVLPPLAERPGIFGWVRDFSGLDLKESAVTFNLGVGMIAVVAPSKVASVLRSLKKSGETAWELGVVTARRSRRPSEVLLRDGEEEVLLDYS